MNQQSADARSLASGRDWYGYLTLDNLDAVADRVRDLIGDGQPYTWVACNEGLREYRPEVRAAQVAKTIRVDRSGTNGALIVVDTYGVWAIHSDAADQAATRGREPEFALTYLKITRGQVQMEHRAPAGYRLYWVVAAEGGAA